MPKKRLLASLAVAAGLGIGGVAGVVLGIPAVSVAQTTTVPPTEDPATPATPDTPADPGDRGDRTKPDGENCPDKDDDSGTEGSSTGTSSDAIFRGGPTERGGRDTQSL